MESDERVNLWFIFSNLIKSTAGDFLFAEQLKKGKKVFEF